EVLKTMQQLKQKYPTKPMVSVFMTTDDFNENVAQQIPDCDVPIFEFVNDAVVGLKGLYDRKIYLDSQRNSTPSFKVNKKAVKKIFDDAKTKDVNNLSVAQSLEVFEAYGLPIPAWGAAHSLNEAKNIAQKIGYPVVLKISSNTILHKSDVGGVAININNTEQLTAKWNTMIQNLKRQNLTDQVDNIVVMKQISNSDREFVVGAIHKGNMGHQIMFGMGGIYIEVLKEVAFRPAPLSLNDANDLLNCTKAKLLMGNIRGKKAVDQKLMNSMLLRLSQLVTDFPIIKEVDANPLLLDDDGNISTVDARIII
ncbi:MAG: acetate--CoA ligase family protein, partial [Clostridia bacterium]|nr:acetate--CoA ligase family protein [Clostridia bacterium]